VLSRRPRRSKNGTPEERAAKRAQVCATSATVTEFPRRAVLAGAAAVVPAIHASALPAKADPIYAAIEAHRCAYAAWGAFLRRKGDDESTEAVQAEAIEHETMAALLDLPTTTASGLLDVLGYLENPETDAYPAIAEDVASFLVSVACAVDRLNRSG